MSEVLTTPGDQLTARARRIWSGGDFHPIARSFVAGAQAFIARLGIRPGEQVLDVACGTGNLAIPAAKAGGAVTGVDIAPNLVLEARHQARLANLEIRFDEGDAESLPYADGQFDTTVSMFGAMFAYRQDRAASELIRVTRAGGRVAMANWTAEGFVGQLLRAHTAVVPPPAGIPSPLAWGDEATVRGFFGARAAKLQTVRRTLEMRFDLGPAEVTDLFARCYGPTVATLAAAAANGKLRLREDLTRLFRVHNQATDGTTVVIGEYLDILAEVAA